MDFLPKYFGLFEKYFKIYMWLKWLQKLLQFVNNVGSENLNRKIDDNNNFGQKLPDSILPLPNIHIANSHILQWQVTGRIPETWFVSDPSISVYSSME
jgi:hypothetical protein